VTLVKRGGVEGTDGKTATPSQTDFRAIRGVSSLPSTPQRTSPIGEARQNSM
jgi:hypothetical protein